MTTISGSLPLIPVTSLPGDIYLAGAFNIFSTTRTNAEEDCNGEVLMVSVMELEAVKWALRRLNDYDFIPGVTLGNFSCLILIDYDQSNRVLFISDDFFLMNFLFDDIFA